MGKEALTILLLTNLLPPEQKEVIWQEETRRLICFLAIEFGVVLMIGVSLLLPSFLPLTFERKELKRALAIEEEASRIIKVDEIAAKGRKVGFALSLIKTFHENASPATSLLGWFLGVKRSGVTITNIVSRKGGEVFLSGIAQTRRSLLNFEEALRSSGRFQEISSPLSNIIRDRDINFTIKGTLKSPYAL